jgi:hypothetical protein
MNNAKMLLWITRYNRQRNTISSASRYAKQTAPAVLLTLKSGA